MRDERRLAVKRASALGYVVTPQPRGTVWQRFLGVFRKRPAPISPVEPYDSHPALMPGGQSGGAFRDPGIGPPQSALSVSPPMSPSDNTAILSPTVSLSPLASPTAFDSRETTMAGDEILSPSVSPTASPLPSSPIAAPGMPGALALPDQEAVKKLKQRKKKQTLSMIVGEQRRQLRLTRQKEAKERAEAELRAKEKADALAVQERERMDELHKKKGELLTVSLPRFIRAKGMWDLMLSEMAERHDWFSIAFVYSAVYPRPFRIALIVTATLVLMFLNALLYYMSYPQGQCEDIHNKKQCLSQTYFYDSTKSFCQWSSRRQQCTYVEPDDNNYIATVLIAVASNMVALPINKLISLIFNHLILPPTISDTLRAEKRLEKIKKKWEDQQQQRIKKASLHRLGWRKIIPLFSPQSSSGTDPAISTASSPAQTGADPAREMKRKNVWRRMLVALFRPLVILWKVLRRPFRRRRGKDAGARYRHDDEEDEDEDDIQRAKAVKARIDAQVLRHKQIQQFNRFLDSEALKTLSKAQEQRNELVEHIAQVKKARDTIYEKLQAYDNATSQKGTSQTSGNKSEISAEEASRWLTQVNFLENRVKELQIFQRKFENKWYLDKDGKPRKVTFWEELRGHNFYAKLRKRIKHEILVARQLEKTLLEMDPEFRELKLLEFQRLDFMNHSERKMYTRNQVDLSRDMAPHPIELWKKILGWSLLILLNLFFGLYVFLWGVKQGAKTTNNWLMSFLGGILQDPFLNMPLVIMYWNVFTPWFIKDKVAEDLESANEAPFVFNAFIPTGPACR